MTQQHTLNPLLKHDDRENLECHVKSLVKNCITLECISLTENVQVFRETIGMALLHVNALHKTFVDINSKLEVDAASTPNS